jgi:hypothetical protein
MANGFALKPSFLILTLAIALSSCAKKDNEQTQGGRIEGVETFPIENTKLKNCKFKIPTPSYAFNASIEANPIICEEGVAKKVQLLTPNKLPNGLRFAPEQLSLTGSANERVVNAPYEFYLENEAGYTIVKILLTVK